MTISHYVILSLFVGALLLAVFFLVKAFLCGMILSHNRGSLSLLKHHLHYVRCFLVATLVAVAQARLLVMLEGGRWGDTQVFLGHAVSIAVSVGVFLSMYFVWTGLKNRFVHRPLSRVFTVSFLFVALTGGILTFQLFQKYGMV